MLPPEARSRLFNLVENNFYMRDGKKCNLRTVVLCSVEDGAQPGVAENFESRFSVSLSLPSLAERPLTERFQLIRQFFTREAAQSSQSLSVASEILIALLLYRCPHHVKQLKNDIRIACANAYVRGLSGEHREIRLAMSDFPSGVRTGLLGYNKQRDDLKDIIAENTSYVFSAGQDMRTKAEQVRRPESDSIYQWIEERTEELKERGIAREMCIRDRAASSAAGTSAGEAKEGEEVTIKITWWGGQSRHDYTQKLLDTYSQAHPNVKFEAVPSLSLIHI